MQRAVVERLDGGCTQGRGVDLQRINRALETSTNVERGATGGLSRQATLCYLDAVDIKRGGAIQLPRGHHMGPLIPAQNVARF